MRDQSWTPLIYSMFYVLNTFQFICTFDCTSAAFFRYNVVFRYLLSVRRVQSELQHCWALQMQRKHLKSNKTDAVKWRLRNHMAFLVDNLQYYLQVLCYLSKSFLFILQLVFSTDHFYNSFLT